LRAPLASSSLVESTARAIRQARVLPGRLSRPTLRMSTLFFGPTHPVTPRPSAVHTYYPTVKFWFPEIVARPPRPSKF
jgi:hypothetical protein